PKTGSLVITPNHQTYADPVLVTIPVYRPIHYMAWSRLFTVPGLGFFIRLLRAFPVQIEGADPRAARAAARLLQAEEAVMIFPEGGRSEEHTSELQSRSELVCRLLLEKKTRSAIVRTSTRQAG